MDESENAGPKSETPESEEQCIARESGYWRANIRLLAVLMTIWFTVSFGCGILFRDFLDQWSLGGYPLGFWFAQQGSIYIFVALIFFYAWKMGKLDRQFDVHED